MKPVIIPFQQQPTTVWSGGQTTQLFIAPAGAVYSQRDFAVRISSATIEVPTSDFTPLPDYNRILMVLEGVLEIEHQGHHTCFLNPYETDNFKGDWTTSAKGLATDFNIIFKSDITPTLIAKPIKQGEQYAIPASDSTTLLFVHKGSGILDDGKQHYPLNALDTCICEPTQTLVFTANETTVMLVVSLSTDQKQ